MRKLIAAINLTIDGYCDHTAGIPDEAVHEHYTQLLHGAGLILYGRKTYQLMQYWQSVLAQPTGNKSIDDFALSIERIPKLVFSRTLSETGWNSAALAGQDLETTVWQLKQQTGGDILVGSPGMIAQLTDQHLVDEWQLCIHPVIAGTGLPLFRNISAPQQWQLVNTKIFPLGHVLHYYHSTHP